MFTNIAKPNVQLLSEAQGCRLYVTLCGVIIIVTLSGRIVLMENSDGVELNTQEQLCPKEQGY